jgi:hypothetical protein
MLDTVFGRLRPSLPPPSEIETTTDEEKARIKAERDATRRELAHLQMRALRLATERRQGDSLE